MEYLLGSLITLFTIFIFNRVIRKEIEKNKVFPVMYNQSTIHETLAPFLPTNQELQVRTLKTQSSNHQKKNSLKILFLADKAYWIKDNAFYTANAIDGIIDEESTSRVDIMGMNDVQLKELSYIVERLTEGIDDENRYSG